LTQDFHLAKRHYDLALEANSEAYLPVLFSLVKLHIKSLWHTLLGGKDGLNIWRVEEGFTKLFAVVSTVFDICLTTATSVTKKGESRGELEGTPDSTRHENANGDDDEGATFDEGDGKWYMGKAKEEFQKRRRAGRDPPRQREEEDPIEVCRFSLLYSH
jgi:SEL1 protein